MNSAGLIMILFASIIALAAIFMFAANMNMEAPVDTNGTTTDTRSNLTRQNVSALSPVVTSVAGITTLIIGAIITFAAVIFLILTVTKKSGWSSRYR